MSQNPQDPNHQPAQPPSGPPNQPPMPNQRPQQSYGQQPPHQDPAQQQYGQQQYGGGANPQAPHGGQPPYGQGPYPRQYEQPYGQAPYGYGSPYPEQKSRILAGLLGLFFGGFGVHRFYLGHTGVGIAQIIVTFVTFGFGWIWGFIEGIMILAGAQMFRRDARGIPLKE